MKKYLFTYKGAGESFEGKLHFGNSFIEEMSDKEREDYLEREWHRWVDKATSGELKGDVTVRTLSEIMGITGNEDIGTGGYKEIKE